MGHYFLDIQYLFDLVFHLLPLSEFLTFFLSISVYFCVYLSLSFSSIPKFVIRGQFCSRVSPAPNPICRACIEGGLIATWSQLHVYLPPLSLQCIYRSIRHFSFFWSCFHCIFTDIVLHSDILKVKYVY